MRGFSISTQINRQDGESMLHQGSAQMQHQRVATIARNAMHKDEGPLHGLLSIGQETRHQPAADLKMIIPAGEAHCLVEQAKSGRGLGQR